MHIDDVHKTLKRSMNTIVKTANAGIEYYEQRIKELKDVIIAANKASADELLPRTNLEHEVQSALTQSIENEISNGPSLELTDETIKTPGAMSRALRRAAREGEDVK